MTERFNVVALSTAGQVHHSNGIVERHNQTLKAMVRRLQRDHPAAPLQELLDLACLAKNSMSIHHSASPFQLMCGSVRRLPAALTDSLPALGDRRVPGDDALRTHLSLLHAARAAHTQSEADVSLRCAPARNASDVPPWRWAVGDVVNYWTGGVHFSPGASEGPAHFTDVGVAKDAVRLQHGNRWVTRHGRQVRPVVSAAVAFNEPAAPPAHAEGASASSLDSASSSGSSSDSEADAPSPSSDATASMLAGARAALRRVGSPPPAAPPVPSAWAGRTRQGSNRRFSALPTNANGSAEAALLSRRLAGQGGLAEYAVGLTISDSDLAPGPGAAASRLRRHKGIFQALFRCLVASQTAFDADWVPLLPGEAGGPPAATPLSAVSPGDAPDAVAHAHRLYAFLVGRVEASFLPGAGRDARLWRSYVQLRANLGACAPTPRNDAVNHALRLYDVSIEHITE